MLKLTAVVLLACILAESCQIERDLHRYPYGREGAATTPRRMT